MKKFALSISFIFCVIGVQAQQAGFTIAQPSKCAPSTVTFTNTSTGSPSSYLWDFGDGTTNSTVKDPQHPFKNAGTYTVTLTTYYGSTPSTFTRTIIVLPPPAFSFGKLNDSVCPGGTISFSSTVTYPSNPNAIQSYLWNFGDGGSSSAANPSYQYMNVPNKPVRYTVSLTVTDTSGCSYKDSISNYIYVKPKPIVNFGVSRSVFCVPDTPAVVTFTDSTTVTTNNTYFWQFSDGGQSTQKNPVHTFHGVGAYSVSLTVTSSEGCSNTLSKTRMVEVIDFKKDIDASDTILCSIPARVTFRPLPPSSTNIEYSWDFGDGKTGQSTFSPIINTFDSVGTYMVTLLANYLNGTCFARDTIRVHVYKKRDIGAYFSINGFPYYWDTVLCDFQYPNPVVFKNITQYPTTDDWGFASTSWWFGDGDSAMKIDPASHVFSDDTDYYHITMRITTPYGCPAEVTRSIWYHSDTPVYLWHSLGGCAPYNAKAQLYQDCWDSKAVILIFDWGDGSLPDTIYDWDFDKCWDPRTDWGNWSKLKPIYNDNGDTCCNYIGFTGRCSRCFGWVPPWIPCACGPLGGTHTYVDTGVFVITATFVDLAGCTYTRIDSTRVGYPPKSWFTWRDTMACRSDMGNALTFVHAFDSLDAYGNLIARSRANSWFWSDIEKNCPWYVFTDTTTLRACDTGYQHIFMVPYHNFCPGDTVYQDSVSYLCPPWAGFFFKDFTFPNIPLLCDYPATIELENFSIGATSYLWYMGDAQDLVNQSTDTNKNPIFTYQHSNPFLFNHSANPGVTITLVAINDDTNINSPTYNRCGYCADTSIHFFLLSEGMPKLVNLPGNVCQGNEVTFYDTGIYNWYVEEETLKFYLSTGGYFSAVLGVPFIFRYMDNYTAILTTVDNLHCVRSDTLYFSIYPQSTVSILSGKDGVHFTQGKDTLCVNNPDILYLKDSSYALPPFGATNTVQWKWIIWQDSITLIDSSSLRNPIFANMRNEGLFDLSLHIVNEYGCTTDSLFKSQILVNRVTPAFYPGREWYCNHSEVEFYNLSYISPRDPNKNAHFTYTWDFGDGTPTFTNTNVRDRVLHTYNLLKLPDTVSVSLTMWADGVCSDTYIGQVVIAGPIASFIDDGSQFPCPGSGRSIHFKSTSTGNPISYHWNFGDTLSATNESYLKEPVHDYLHAGHYDVSLIVRDAMYCADTLIVPKLVFIDGPIGDFIYGELSGCVEHTVIFTPSTVNTDSVKVNPDGASPITDGGANVNNPLFYTYKIPNAYVPYFYLIKWVKDTLTNDSIRCVVEWTGKDTIFVVDMVPDFAVDSIYCPNPVEFPNTTTLLPPTLRLDSVFWQFGNGDSLRAIDGYTQYNTTGKYTVTMKAYAKQCYKQISKEIKVIDMPNGVGIEPDTATICGNELMVSFTVELKDTIPDIFTPQYEWLFADSESMSGNPTSRTFYSSGTYPYQLLVNFGVSNCMQIYFDTIEIQVRAIPTAEFEPNPQTVNYGEEIRFIDQSTQGEGKLVYWYWNFGDNTESNLQNPVHNYTTTSGYIPVLLWVEDEFGCKDSIKHDVVVLESLDFPNLFSPIGSDGKRYYFRPLEEKGYFKDFEITVYNRWGNLVWKRSCTDPNCPNYDDSFWWDGTNKFGKPVSYGVYFWVVKATPLSGTKPMLKNGSVTIISK